VLQQPPDSVDLTFSEGITLLPDSVRVFGPDGNQVDDGKVVHEHGDAGTAGVGLDAHLATGTYLVSYRIVSADSHPISGAYTFSIGHRTAAPTAAAVGGSNGIPLTLGFSRWVSYAGSALGLGGLAFLSWCWLAGWSSPRARRIVDVGVGLLTVGTALALLLKGPYDAGRGISHVVDGALFREVLGTTYGRAMVVRLLLMVCVISFLRYRERLSGRVLTVGPGILLFGVGVTFALGGHAAAGGHRLLAIASDTTHVAAMSIWLGGLAMLGAVVLTADAQGDEALPVVQRFSRLAAAMVGVLAATGAYQALRELRSWDALFFSHYGHVLLVKLAIVATALLAAAVSRAWVWQSRHPVVPVLAATTEQSVPVTESGPSIRSLRTSVRVESVLLAGVLAASAVLVSSNPTRTTTFTPKAVSTTVKVGPDSVRVSANPTGQNRVLLSLQVLDKSGKPVNPREVDATFFLVDQQIGPLDVVLSEDSTRGHRTGAASLPVSGRWQLAVTVRTTAIDQATASVEVPVG
jgi:copper transport protein